MYNKVFLWKYVLTLNVCLPGTLWMCLTRKSNLWRIHLSWSVLSVVPSPDFLRVNFPSLVLRLSYQVCSAGTSTPNSAAFSSHSNLFLLVSLYSLRERWGYPLSNPPNHLSVHQRILWASSSSFSLHLCLAKQLAECEVGPKLLPHHCLQFQQVQDFVVDFLQGFLEEWEILPSLFPFGPFLWRHNSCVNKVKSPCWMLFVVKLKPDWFKKVLLALFIRASIMW